MTAVPPRGRDHSTRWATTIVFAVVTVIVIAVVGSSSPRTARLPGVEGASDRVPGSTDATPPGAGTPAAAPVAPTERGPRPVLGQAAGSAAGTEPRVFAHYFPPYPISIDNKPSESDYYAVNYLSPGGEFGNHRAYGGLLRDRPLGRAPLTGDWELADMLTEIRQAKSAGIDGFTLNVLGLSGRTWDISLKLMEAADLEGEFAILPMLDATSLTSTPAEIATGLATLYAHPSAYRIGGAYVLASFCAECHPVAWWTDLIDQLGSAHTLSVRFFAGFVGVSETLLQSFAPISYAAGSWGTRNAVAAASGPNWAAVAHGLGLRWMQAVAMQDARPRSGVYAEAGNTETFRTTWGRAITDGADFVQIATWNDYSESTAVAPSVAHGWAYLQLCGYFTAWFKGGTAPVVAEDHVVLTHRGHAWAARATSGVNNMEPTLGESTVRPRDTVEALVFLASPATVTLTSGEYTTTVDLPAGMSPVQTDLGAGRPRVWITRGSETVLSLTSPYPVVARPLVQDLQYLAAIG